ncbi:aldehyde dehydrogenase family protein [Luteolibacter soli]|uniref:Aldehyde dehydrogenase n=1 Tax=Luteolibacter soli TaxID=3135280 RepID=A0ABU9B449_9BACT
MSGFLLPDRQRAWLASQGSRDVGARKDSLKKLLAGLDRYETSLIDALNSDLGKSPIQAYTSEIHLVRQEIGHALKHLRGWMKPQRRKVPALAWPGRAEVNRDPCGSVLIIGPWNYPVQLLLTPLVGVLAAGSCAVLKPSEHAPATSAAVAKLVADSFDPGEVCVVEGDGERAAELAAAPFDHIFFTGGIGTGRKIAAVAGGNLVPVTLELGGKCPVLLFPAATERERTLKSLNVIARRIAWGKYLNAGQTCVAPDHVLVDRGLAEPLVDALGRAFDSFGREDLGRIVNRSHFDRLIAYLGEGRIRHGGKYDFADLMIEPTVVTDLPTDASVLQEEIFGPILPVVPYEDLEQALAALEPLPAPLALYAFTRDPGTRRRITARTKSGSLCFNDTVVQITGPTLPFGGLGPSGMGRYRGRASFDAFTRERSVMTRSVWPDLPFRYPPSPIPLGKLRKFLRRFGER